MIISRTQQPRSSGALLTNPEMGDIINNRLLPSLSPRKIALLSGACKTFHSVVSLEKKAEILMERFANKLVSWSDVYDCRMLLGPECDDLFTFILSGALDGGLGKSNSEDLLKLLKENTSHQIEKLHLPSCEISDRGLLEIALRCSNLAAICLALGKGDTQEITDEGIQAFIDACPTLQRISLKDRTCLSDKKIGELKKSRQWTLFVSPKNDDVGIIS